MSTDKLAEEQIKAFETGESKRKARFDSAWQSITNYFLSNRSNVNTQKTEGTTGWSDKLYDSTGVLAAKVLRAGQLNWLTPANEPWAVFEPPEFLKAEGREDDLDSARQWLANASEVVMREKQKSNFYAKVSTDYMQCGTIGTGIMFCDEGKRTALNYRQFEPWHCDIAENDEGIVDTVRREFELTVRQARQWFGEDQLSEQLKKMSEIGKSEEKKFKFIHAVFPREDSKRIKGRMTGDNKPIASVYIERETRHCCEVSGYDEMPYFVSRFDEWGTGSVWGYSPAFDALCDARQANYVKQFGHALHELKAYPRFLEPDTMEGDTDLRPGGRTTVNADDMKSGVLPREWLTQGDGRDLKEDLDELKDAINKHFYVNMFTMLEQLADKKMTAYEIAQRIGEKLEQFTPVFYRRITEFLNPMLLRDFGILYRKGLFGQAPQSLMVQNPDGTQSIAMPSISITSRISLALKALQNAGFNNTMEGLGQLAQARPDILDNFDLDEGARKYALNNGVDSKLLMPIKKRDQIRAQRQAQQEKQNAMMQAEQMSKAAKNLGGAPQQVQDQAMQAAGG
jgi:hypothetical protein